MPRAAPLLSRVATRVRLRSPKVVEVTAMFERPAEVTLAYNCVPSTISAVKFTAVFSRTMSTAASLVPFSILTQNLTAKSPSKAKVLSLSLTSKFSAFYNLYSTSTGKSIP